MPRSTVYGHLDKTKAAQDDRSHEALKTTGGLLVPWCLSWDSGAGLQAILSGARCGSKFSALKWIAVRERHEAGDRSRRF
ncbi:hypothetical protein [Microtetraspora malaysiensis]|uniref:hypothetical protein n=1 Tax=Microtetraspora malaysiensis TaxID=161358 RepID=UPI003D8BEB01